MLQLWWQQHAGAGFSPAIETTVSHPSMREKDGSGSCEDEFSVIQLCLHTYNNNNNNKITVVGVFSWRSSKITDICDVAFESFLFRFMLLFSLHFCNPGSFHFSQMFCQSCLNLDMNQSVKRPDWWQVNRFNQVLLSKIKTTSRFRPNVNLQES